HGVVDGDGRDARAGPAIGVHAYEAIIVDADVVENRIRIGGGVSGDQDPVPGIVADDRIGDLHDVGDHRVLMPEARPDAEAVSEPVTVQIADAASLDAQRPDCAGADDNSIAAAEPNALDGEPAQGDREPIGIDQDAGAAARYQDAGFADAVIDDTDALP